MRRRWKLPDEGAVQQAATLASALGVPRAFASVLVSHGVTTRDEAADFLSPDISMLHDLSLIHI